MCGGGYERVSREVKDLHRSLQDKVDARKRDLQLGLPADIRWVHEHACPTCDIANVDILVVY